MGLRGPETDVFCDVVWTPRHCHGTPVAAAVDRTPESAAATTGELCAQPKMPSKPSRSVEEYGGVISPSSNLKRAHGRPIRATIDGFIYCGNCGRAPCT